MLRHEAPFWAQLLPQLPRLLHRALAEDRGAPLRLELERLARESARRNDLLAACVALAAVALVLVALFFF
jgi:hypothetical protein